MGDRRDRGDIRGGDWRNEGRKYGGPPRDQHRGGRFDDSWGGQPDEERGGDRFGGPPRDRRYGGPRNEGRYGGPPDEERYGGSYDGGRRFDRYGGPRNESRYGGPPNEGRYGQPSSESRYGGPPNEGRYGQPPSESRYGGPPNEGRYGQPPSESRYGGPPNEGRYGQPPSESRYGGPPNEGRYGQPPSESRYGGPPNESRYGGSRNESGFGRPPNEGRYGQPSSDNRYGNRSSGSRFGGQPDDDRYAPPESRYGAPSGGSRYGNQLRERNSGEPSENRYDQSGGGNRYTASSSDVRYSGQQGGGSRYNSSPRGGFDGPSRGGRGGRFGQGDRGSNTPPCPMYEDGQSAAGDVSEVIEQMERVSITGGPPCRPDNGGTVGQPIAVRINCWDMTIADRQVLMYDIDAIACYRNSEKEGLVQIKLPPKDLRSLLKHVVASLPSDVVYDGGRIIYTTKQLENGNGDEPDTLNLPVPDPTDRDELVLKYTLKLVQTTSTGDLARYVADPRASSHDMPQESIRMIDCIFKSINQQSFVSFGRSAVFYPTPMKQIHDKLFDIHMGFIASVRPQWKIRVNVDMTCKAFFPTGKLADILYGKYGDSIEDSQSWDWAERDIKRLRVEAKFYTNEATGKAYSRRFTVFGLSKVSADQLIIIEKDMSVYDYFKEKYNITLEYPRCPCVKVSSTREIYIPMELLTVLPYQAPTASKADIASEIIRCAAVKPAERFRELDKYVHQIVKSRHELLKLYDLNVEVQRKQVQARVLPTPMATFGGRESELGRGKWDANSFLHPANDGRSINWAIVCVLSNERNRCNTSKEVNMLKQQLPRCANSFGVRLSNNPPSENIYPAQIETLLPDLQNNGFELCVLVLYNTKTYPIIKRLSDLHIGLRTQCVKAQTLNKPRVLPNLMLKINGKLGGVNWQVTNYPLKDSVMVFGADVTHPAPTQNDECRQSVAAVLGSVTPDLMRYAAVVRCQNTTENNDKKRVREIIDNMDEIVAELLKAYYEANNQFPNRLIFYRDGVSEGQFATVLTNELPAIQRACTGLRPGYEPKITYIVVQKRHHIRFEPLDPRAKNVAPGTVVDTSITHRREFDFYLCSQEGIQGTSKPSHYHVLYDDSDFDSNSLQLFTYYLCHAYMRCPRSVSYPAPTYYSHLAAFRARDWLTDSGSADLTRKNRFMVHRTQFTGMFFL